MHVYDARCELLSAALGLAASQQFDYAHPENPNGDAELEWREEMLDDAIDRYITAKKEAQGCLID